MIKKIILIVTILFLMFFAFVFLKKKEENNLVFWTIQLKPVAVEFIEENIKLFEVKHPNIKVVWVDIPIAEAQKRILASILGGNPPDIVNLNPDFSVILAQLGALETFEDYEVKDFSKNLMEGLKYDDKYFGIPFYATSAVTLVNRGCTDKYPKTYDDILNIKTNCTNFALNLNENDTLSRILNKYQVYNFEDEKSYKNSELVFNIFKKMYDEGKIPKDSLVINHMEVVEKYMTGKVAVVVVGGNFVKMVKENAKSIYDNSEILPQLTSKNGGYDVSLMNFVIPKKAKNKELAKEFLSLLTNRENQIKFSKLTNVLAVRDDALLDDFFACGKKSELVDFARCVGAYQLKNANYKTFGYKNKKEINDIINENIENYLINGKFSVDLMAEKIKKLQESE